jgi:hypothetical protein
MMGITFRKRTGAVSARALAAACVVILVGGCGSVSPPPLSAMEACGDLAQKLCAKRAACTNGAGITRVNGDMTTCIAEEQQLCMLAGAAPDTGASPRSFENCAASYDSQSCTDFLNGTPPVACTPAGTRAMGAPCAFNGQCQSAFCVRNKSSICGACAPQPAVGDPCVDGNCAHGQTCVGSPRTCQALVAVNQPCNGQTCSAGLNCVGDNSVINMGTGTCMMAGATAGAACGANSAGCAGVLGLACSGPSGSKTCMAMTFGDDGAACGPSTADVVRSSCKAGGCYTDTGPAAEPQTGTCKADVDPGAACDTTLGPACKPPGRCVTDVNGTAGTCMTPAPTACG